jgi:hypothetical protein
MFASLGLIAFVGALIAAGANELAFQLNLIDVGGQMLELSMVGAGLALMVVFLAFLFGGWVAGRMSLGRGGLNGLGTGLWLLLLVAVFALAGALWGPEYNAFGPAGLPDWFSAIRSGVRTTGSLVVAVLFAAAALAGGFAGGRLGETFRHRVEPLPSVEQVGKEL